MYLPTRLFIDFNPSTSTHRNTYECIPIILRVNSKNSLIYFQTIIYFDCSHSEGHAILSIHSMYLETRV